MREGKKLAVTGTVMLGVIVGIGGTNAYLTSYDQAVNMIGVGKNVTTIDEEASPMSVSLESESAEYPETVRVTNGTLREQGKAVDCYVRVALGYSNDDIGRAVILKQPDQKNWIKAGDGFYYYKQILREGESTTPLFSGIKVDSSDQRF